MEIVQEKAFQEFIGIREFDGEKYVKYEKYQETLEKYENRGYEIDELKEKIYEMDQHIKCLKSDLEEVQNNRFELQKEPIKVAEMLIDEKITYETSSIAKAFGAGDTETCNLYSKSDLRQIAEHLLVYCNNSEDGDV